MRNLRKLSYVFGIFILFTLDLQVYDITRHYIGNKNHQVVYFCDGFSFGSHIRYCYLLQQGKFFSLSCHFYTNLIIMMQK